MSCSERCFVLEEKLREVTGDDTITWQAMPTNELESVETTSSGTTYPGNEAPATLFLFTLASGLGECHN